MRKIVISLGGSVIVPGKINQSFIQGFYDVILRFIKNGNKVVIVTGGGIIAREYIKVLKNSYVNEYNQSQVGVYATRLNASLIASFFNRGRIEIPHSINEFKEQYRKSNVVVLGGIMPGTTSDGTGAVIAKLIGADEFINVTNVDGLYNKDPMKNRTVKLIPYITHKDFYSKYIKKMKYEPGQHFVLDQEASLVCKKENIRVVILKGLENLEKCLNNQEFIGTIID